MNEIINIEHNNERVLTTEQLAQVYECDGKQIKKTLELEGLQLLDQSHRNDKVKMD